MHDYQYNLEVVSIIPTNALADTGDGRQRKLVLHCTRRDAIIDCTVAPSSFEVRNAPNFELVSISLVSADGAGGAEHVEASSSNPLLVGGPHRTVGAVWVPLGPAAAADPAPEGSPLVSRVFVAWSVTRMDGDPAKNGHLPASPAKTTLSMPDATASSLISSPFVPSAREDCPSPNDFSSTHRGVTWELECGESDALKPSTATTAAGLNTSNAVACTSSAGVGSSLSCDVVGMRVPPRHGVIGSDDVFRPRTTSEAGSAGGRRLTESATTLFSDDAGPASLLISRLPLGSSVTNPAISAGGQTARVSIVVDEQQKTSEQLIENEGDCASRTPSKHVGEHTAAVQDALHRASAVDTASHAGASSMRVLGGPTEQQASGFEDVVLEQFPLCSVSLRRKSAICTSSPHSPVCTLAAESRSDTAHVEEGAEDTGAFANQVVSLPLDSALAATDARTPTWVDYYASSTQAIGVVPLQTRFQNLYTVPSPPLLGYLKNQLAPPSSSAASPTAEPAPVTYHELWYARRRQSHSGRAGGSGSAQEEIRREQEAKRSGGTPPAGMQIGDNNSSASLLGSPMAPLREPHVEVRTESALTLLRRQALDGLQRQRVMY
ncbi:hypothetical protein, conserved [Leishmania tarentolae]|uniref:Uncharacterized protein n=1 Tax=Leishmania tarentolae TaxID=5689 RepID=A0A640KP76_LEITA|nr:hypothetical protein, conserved [Leishmania tarentolae]